MRELDPADIRGRIIVLPAANLPAAMAGTRVSPIDEGNLNRAFPGDPDSTPTFAIAHYIDSVLYPMADFHHDLHSGGSSLQYLPFASMRQSDKPELDRRALDALQAFGAPIGLVWAYSPDRRVASVAATARGLVALGGEFGGGGSVSTAGVRIIEQGLRNLLAHASIIDASSAVGDFSGPTRLMQVTSRDYYVYAPEAGLFEPAVELGDDVRAGQLCGNVHFVDKHRDNRSKITCARSRPRSARNHPRHISFGVTGHRDGQAALTSPDYDVSVGVRMKMS